MRPTYHIFLGLLTWGGSLFSTQVFAQGCPACSNPALQSSEKLEAGVDTLHIGSLRVTFNATNGFNYQGGHDHNRGLSPEGQEIDVPLHEHVVDLDFIRTEISLEYTFKTNWTVWLRLPYDVKSQTASINYIETASTYQKEAMLRNRDIHHRSESYMGISDPRLLVSHRINGFLSKKGRLDIAVGTTLPFGKTEENPLEAGENGVKHLHIQFGSGTLDPLLELHYVVGLSDKFSLGLYSINKFPFYQNSKSYLAAIESTSGIGLGYKMTDWFFIRATFANFSQSQAKWSGEKDPNSGLISFNSTANLTFKLKNGLLITPGYRFPITQRTLSNEGDAFTYGHTFVLNLSYFFTKPD
ncbi:MAG: hypothetical protein JKY42_07515 [Flavobacteriales bacterium]|nr:hypothetical protein [Flavobacteriales bacterium]